MAEVDWGLWLRPGDHVVCSHMSAEPVDLLQSLARYEGLPKPLHFMLGVPFSMAAADLPDTCMLMTYGGMGSAGALSRQRSVALSMLNYRQAEAVYETGLWRCDVALVALGRSPDGQLHMAPTHGPIMAAARRARHIVAQVSPNVPCVNGTEWPEDLKIDQLLEVDTLPLIALPNVVGDIERVIAGHVATLVPDGACLQIGIGAQPSAVLDALSTHQHLGIHSGMLTPSLWKLMERGVADQSRKLLDPGVAVVGSVYGDKVLYSAVHRHTQLMMRSPSMTHDPQVIATQPDMFCLNSALEVDLLGGMNAEAVVQPDGKWRFVGGVGGLPDFVRAAVHSPRGQSVIALHSRTQRQQARIVARLSGPATLSASDADVVVTEYGIARLRGRSMSERAHAMIAIAHPEDRIVLEQQVRSMGLA